MERHVRMKKSVVIISLNNNRSTQSHIETQPDHSLFEYIELFYNRKHKHSRLDNISPTEYHKRHRERKIAQTVDLGTHIQPK
jgi:hypothetical protein